MALSEEKRIEDVISYPILLAERIRSTVQESESFKSECFELGKQVDKLSQILRSLVRFTTSTSSFVYERPIRRVIADASRTLEKTLALARKCKRQNLLRRLCTITSATDFRKIANLLDGSIGDMKWIFSIFDVDGFGGGGGGGGIVLSLPPIASNDPILAWVWSYIASMYMGQLSDRIEAANELALLALDNDRNKQIIVEEEGVPSLLRLLKEGSSPEAQIAASTALCNLANSEDRVRVIVSENGVNVIVQVLGDSTMQVQTRLASLVARMAEHDPLAQDDFARENAIRPLVTLLSFETFVEEQRGQVGIGRQSIHSVVQMNKERGKGTFGKSSSHLSLSHLGHKKERENESPEVKLRLKISCAKALWMLARGSVQNSRRITETKGLLCLAKLVEKEQGELQYNCLMAIMEITAAAESNADLRRAAFRTTSPAAKAVVEQLLWVVKELDDPSLQIPAIRSIGSLARTFSARETRVLVPLVSQLSHRSQDMATEAAISLGKFACPENFNCKAHSKAIIEANAVPPLMRLLRTNEKAQLHALFLLCYLAIHTGDNEALEQARVLTALEGVDRSVAGHHPELGELIYKAIYQLKMYHAGNHPLRESYGSYIP